MKCPHKDCVNSPDCAIIEITGKVPESFNDCSYSKTTSQAMKQQKKKSQVIYKKPAFKSKQKWSPPKSKRKRELTND